MQLRINSNTEYFIIPGLEAKRLHLPQMMIIQVLIYTERSLIIILVKENRSTRVYLLKR